MKTTNNRKKKGRTEVEADFSHSPAGLGTHRKNCVEQQRLEERLRSLDLLRRRSVQLHQDEQRVILQHLEASQSPVNWHFSSQSGDGCFQSQQGSSSPCRPERRASLQVDYTRSGTRLEPSSRCCTPLIPARCIPSRRPSVALQDFGTKINNFSSKDPGMSSGDTDIETDVITASIQSGRTRRRSVGALEIMGVCTVRGDVPRVKLTEDNSARRRSLEVGVTGFSPLPPTLTSGREGRRCSVASSQGLPSTLLAATHNSKSRDGVSLTFPSVRHRHLEDVRPQLICCQSSENLIPSSTSYVSQKNVTPAALPQLRHNQGSSLKLRTVRRHRKSVSPSENRMVLLHNILQNSSTFLKEDSSIEEQEALKSTEENAEPSNL